MPTYRTNGAWGAGIGVNLTPAQVDNNFYELRTDLDDIIANPPTADGLDSVTQSGFYLTFHTTLGNTLGPIAIPVVYTVWRGDWAPFTLYSAADIFRVVDVGIFSVLQDHTSAATFDPDEAGGSPLAPYYNELIGVTSLPADTSLDELNDVTITSAADGDLIAWDNGLSQWTNRTPGDVLALLAPTLDDLTDVIAPSPAVGQILRYLGGSPDKGWQPDTLSLDDLDDVSVAAPNDGDLLTYQAGSPTGWIAAPPAVIPSALDDLSDVIAPSPSDGDLLQFDGADWINASGMSVSGLDDAFLPLVSSDLFEVSQSSGSPPGSPPVGYESRKATLAHIMAAGGFTLGSTSIALGGTTATVAGLTFSGGTLSGNTTLPGSGQISSLGELGIGTTPLAQVHIGGTYTTSNGQLAAIGGTLSSTLTSNQFGLINNHTFVPGGASLSNAVGISARPGLGTSSLNVTTYSAFEAIPSTAAGYSGTVTTMNNYQGNTPTVSGSNPLTNFNGFRQNAITNGNGITTGTVTNTGIMVNAATAAAGAGGTVVNTAGKLFVPSSSSAGNTDRGLWITGNGGAASTKYAIYSDSTAASQLSGTFQATELQQAGLNGGITTIKTLSELTTIAAAAFTDTTIQIPANALVIAVAVRSNVAIPTAVTYDVGVSGATTRYATAVSDAVGTTSTGTADGVRYYSAATSIRITPDATPASNTGRVRVSIRYIEITPPSS